MKINAFIFLLLSICSDCYSQKLDSLLGPVKNIREKVIFLTNKENPNIIYDSDYGHYGFLGPESSVARFKNLWYDTYFSYYINRDSRYDRKQRLIRDDWFYKNGILVSSFQYLYDDQDRLIVRKDSTGFSVELETHYWEDDKHETVIHKDYSHQYFSFDYYKYDENKNLILFRSIDRYGDIDQKKYEYDENGNLITRISIIPSFWNDIEKKHEAVVNKFVDNVYTDFSAEYNDNGRLIKVSNYEIENNDLSKGIIKDYEEIYHYDKERLTHMETRHVLAFGNVSLGIQEYDEKERILKLSRYYNSKEDLQSQIVYDYDGDLIVGLKITETEFPSNNLIVIEVVFDYKFDDEGNWIEISKVVDGKELYKWIRNIEYYSDP
jgi:hypothetical protein